MNDANHKSRPSLAAGYVACLLLLLGAPGGGAQEVRSQSGQVAPGSAAAPPPQAGEGKAGRDPGVFETIGRWFDQGARNIQDHWRGTKAPVDDLNDRAAANAKDMSDRAEEMRKGAAEAVEAVAKLPGTRVMSGRERCTVAPNGAPDCVAAAEALCRKHGFSSGKSVDFTSAEECSPRAVLSGRVTEADCSTVTFISRAMCQ
jgi:hypothetical protein